jgi:hypothetical protein
MSQVNDALKRASKADRNRGPHGEKPSGTLKSAATQGDSPLGGALVICLLLVLGLGGWFAWQWWQAKHHHASGRKAPVVAGVPRPEPPSGVTEAAPTTSVVDQASDPPSDGQPAGDVWPAELKLSGIIFNPRNPIATINGKPVGVGDAIEGVHITKIERQQVTVEWKGKLKVLTMD